MIGYLIVFLNVIGYYSPKQFSCVASRQMFLPLCK